MPAWLSPFVSFLNQHLGELYASALGAVAGSIATYRLQLRIESGKATEERRSEILRVQSALIIQFETLTNIKKVYLDPFWDDEQRASKVAPISFVDACEPVNVGALWFLVRKDSADITIETARAQRAYSNAADNLKSCLRLRNELLSNPGDHYPQRISGFSPGLPNIERVRRPEVESLFTTIPDALAKIQAANERIRVISSQRFPSKHRDPIFLRITGFEPRRKENGGFPKTDGR